MPILDEKFRALLDEPRFAVIATINPDGSPQQTVVWYLLEGDEIMMNTTADRVKARNLTRDPRISFCIEDEYRYVTMTGTVRLVTDHATAVADIHRLAVRYLGPEQAAVRQAVFATQPRLTFYMQIERINADMD